ncbi:phage antirepressor protein [Desmospora sp. 8437]|nr:phage antirepressor protein [Desmospora sp. 8437]
MSNVIHLTVSDRQHEMTVKEYRRHRVITFKDVDSVHNRPEGHARKRFNDNKERFVEGKHYFVVKPGDLQMSGIRTSEINNRGTIVLTQSGYLRLVKTFGDDLAWDIQDILIESYFQVQQNPQPDPTLDHERLNVDKAKVLVEIGKHFPEISGSAKQVLASVATEFVTGQRLIELPKTEAKYKAGEIGKILGITGNMVGRLANEFGLKSDEYAEQVLDKSAHSSKMVPNWLYKESALERFHEITRKKGIGIYKKGAKTH